FISLDDETKLCEFRVADDSIYLNKRLASPEMHTLSLHDALPISHRLRDHRPSRRPDRIRPSRPPCRRLEPLDVVRVRTRSRRVRSEEHTSELQSRFDLVCRLLREDNNE